MILPYSCSYSSQADLAPNFVPVSAADASFTPNVSAPTPAPAPTPQLSPVPSHVASQKVQE